MDKKLFYTARGKAGRNGRTEAEVLCRKGRVCMEESPGIRFLYHTLPGRAMLKILVSPGVSRGIGAFLDSRLSTSLIPLFIRKYHIDTWDILVPEKGFSSFNDFFKRKREDEKFPTRKGELISPCDGYLTCIPIRKDTIYHIKHTAFRLGELLGDEKLAEEFEDGYALVFRLTPAHYHRYCHVADGIILRRKRIGGILHCVRPIVTAEIPVYVRNTREYQVVRTEEFGKLVQMEIGAMLVGRITNHRIADRRVRAWQEKGYFEYGGSTIVVLVQKGRIRIKDSLREGSQSGSEIYKREFYTGEVPVRQGMAVAERTHP